ncbi:MAG: CDP-glycerol glycerophosphotransferase family protein, partial [Candidatus Omnitrophica bacterium]|nr:CDP-glycerol glycerophosphotransferase family protein [Candidatus Omnitrophota bacterium]
EGIYMPTYRGEEGSLFSPFELSDFDVNKIDSFCQNHNIHLYIKTHPSNKPKVALLKQIQDAQNISFYEIMDIYPNLNRFDFLITDFSSIYFDYLLLDRPIIFAPFCFDDYINNDRQLFYNYNEVTPGPKAYNWEEVLTQIELCLRDPEIFSLEREQMRSYFHQFQDNNSCQRVYNEIITLLKHQNTNKGSVA